MFLVSQFRRHSAIARGVACLAGALLVAAMPGVMPVLMAALAVVDGGHRVEMGVNTEEARVVLHHDPACLARSPQHHHGLLGRTLVIFSESPSGEPDHILHFAGAGKFLRSQTFSVMPAGMLAVQNTTPFCFAPVPTAPRRLCCFPGSPAPPGALTGVRTTLLLI